MKKIFYLFSFLLVTQQLHSQNYFRNISVTNNDTVDYSNYQVLLQVNTEELILAGKMLANGDDIRFSADSCAPVTFYNYWIESGINTDSTSIWVMLPSINSLETKNLYMWYGNPSATSSSSFSSTFPSAIVSSGNLSGLTGTINPGWFELNASDTLFLSNTGTPLVINARKIIINGRVEGTGRGYQPGGTAGAGSTGLGPGGGTPASPMNSGSGGGSYAGLGGTGGFDPGDSPGNGGAVYGTTNGFDIESGSAGGSSDLDLGGAGGGSLTLDAEYLEITGTVELTGRNGQAPGGGRGAGGGAGGGLLAKSNHMKLTNTAVVNAKGGNGSVGTSTANDSGGGGGGGRIKTFHGPSFINLATNDVSGGLGGPNGTGGPGQNGGSGTVFDSTITFLLVVASIDTADEEIVVYNFSTNDTSLCDNGSSLNLVASPFSGTFSGTGVSGNTFDPSIAGAGLHTIVYSGNICSTNDSIDITVFATPTAPTITPAGTTTFCDGGSVDISSTTGDNYLWNTGATTNSITVSNSDTVFVQIESNDGCVSDTSNMIIVSEIDCSSIEEENSLVTIYPNPTTSFVTIQTTEKIKSIHVIDMMGKVVSTFIDVNMIDISSLDNGIYTIMIFMNNTTSLKKVIKKK